MEDIAAFTMVMTMVLGVALAAADALWREVAELAERVDFTGRLLAQSRAQGRLAPPPLGGVAR